MLYFNDVEKSNSRQQVSKKLFFADDTAIKLNSSIDISR